MIGYRNNKFFIIWLSFFITLLLQIMPWPKNIAYFRPNWIFLVLIYWILTLPHLINIGTSFIVGLILDLINGSILGINSLVMSIIAYIIATKYYLFSNFVLWQQMLIVTLLSLMMNIAIFCINVLFIHVTFKLEILWSSIIDGILWPWLFLLLHKINKQYNFQ